MDPLAKAIKYQTLIELRFRNQSKREGETRWELRELEKGERGRPTATPPSPDHPHNQATTHTTKHRGGDTVASALWLMAFSTWLVDSKLTAPRSRPNLHELRRMWRLTCMPTRWIYTTWRHVHGSEAEPSQVKAASLRHVLLLDTSTSSWATLWSSRLENKVVLVQVKGCIDDLSQWSGRSLRGLREGLVLVHDSIGEVWSRGPDLLEVIRRAAWIWGLCLVSHKV